MVFHYMNVPLLFFNYSPRETQVIFIILLFKQVLL